MSTYFFIIKQYITLPTRLSADPTMSNELGLGLPGVEWINRRPGIPLISLPPMESVNISVSKLIILQINNYSSKKSYLLISNSKGTHKSCTIDYSDKNYDIYVIFTL